jgi:protein-L-isoaspartate(D-aspartate) O-methyltransferase
MNIEQARFNMVEQQIRTWEVLDQNVLDLLFKVKREEFVPAAYRDFAFVDMEIPLGDGEIMLAPKLEARIVQELGIQSTDVVLEIGSGSGYMTALLAHQAEQVHSVEINPTLKNLAEQNLKKQGLKNITLELGDGAQGWGSHQPYDVIVLTGSTPVLPKSFLKQLNVGGRLFAVVGDAPIMKARLITHQGDDAFHTTDLFETSIPSLKNAAQPERFVF